MVTRPRTIAPVLALLALACWAVACGDGATEPPVAPPPPPPDPPRATTLTVTPATASLGVPGETVRLAARVLDQNGQPMAGAAVSWSSGNASVATVDASGLVRGVSEGTATINATSGAASGSAEITVKDPDRAALAALYEALGGSNWADNTNWFTDAPVGEWHGVETDGEGRITAIRLNENDLSGPIPPELGGLANLRVLNLGANDLSGPIPPELGGLANLEELYLMGNDLSGPIPPELGGLANLRVLDLEGNDLSGPIPPELSGLANLADLRLFQNQLTGPIPPELSGLSHLRFLELGGNDLSGPIPPELGGLANLEELHLYSNQLTGAIPPELGGLSHLLVLVLGGNDLSGPIPPELGGLTNLHTLEISRNAGLTGPLPLELRSLPLTQFFWAGTGLCSPPDPSFQSWLASIRSSGGDNYSGGPVCGNRSPETVGSISDRTITVGGRDAVDVSSYFSDPDGDALTYTASSSNTRVATVWGSSVVNIDAVAAGTSTIRITATDPGNLSAEQSFTLTVVAANRFPEPVGTIPDQTVTVGDTATVDVSSYFRDPDGDTLTYVVNWSGTVASIWMSGSSLKIRGLRAGSTRGVVIAIDPGGLQAAQGFEVTVEEGGDVGDAISLELTTCSASQITPGIPTFRITMAGTVTANRAVTLIVVKGYANGQFMGLTQLGSIAAGRSKNFSISGTLSTTSTTVLCEVFVEGRVSASTAGQDGLVRASARDGIGLIP